MLFRAIALSVALLVGGATLIAVGTDLAEAGPRKQKRYKKKREWKGVKKYSKRWWQLYRAQERRKKALAAKKRALRLRQMRLEETNAAADTNDAAKTEEAQVALLPSGQQAPAGWKPGDATGSEVRFRVEDGSGSPVGSASISVVGPADGETVTKGRHRSLAGVPTKALRREVINQMIRENGWVVNDYQKDIGNGRTVYVVEAQSQTKGGSVQSRMFYFAEADGRIYSVATNSAADSAERLAEESEKVIYSLQGRQRPTQQAAVKAVVVERPKETALPPCAPAAPQRQ